MKAEGEKGSKLEQAKQTAIEIANSFRVGTQFVILTNDFLQKHRYPLNKEQFIQQIAELKVSVHSPKLSEIYTRAILIESESKKRQEKSIFFLSDFQKNTSDFETIKPDSSVVSYLLPFPGNNSNNLLIDSCWFEVPVRKISQSEKLFVQISNKSDQAYQNIPVRLTINDSLKAISNISIAGNEKTIVELNYSNNSGGLQLCKIELDDYPIIYDNSWYMSYRVQEKLNALGIFNPQNNGSGYLKSLFADDELITYAEFPENNVQISELNNSSCIFLVNSQNLSSGVINELNSFVKDGGTLVIFPDQLKNYQNYNDLLSKLQINNIDFFDTASMSISAINYSHDLFKDVFKKQEENADLPVIKGSTVFNNQTNNRGIDVLTFRNGKSALISCNSGLGNGYLFAFPLSNANLSFIRHILFVPIVYNMVLNSGIKQKYAYSLEQDDPVLLNLNNPQSEIKIINHQNKDEFISSARTLGPKKQQLILDELLLDAGHFLVLDGSQINQSLSFNYSRQESETAFYSEKELQKLLQSDDFKQFQLLDAMDSGLNESIQDYNNGKQFWKHFIVLAIIFLLLEMAIIRFWK